MNPRQQPDQIVLAAKREHGVDQIVADTCLALLDFEAIGEEGGQPTNARRNRVLRPSTWAKPIERSPVIISVALNVPREAIKESRNMSVK